MSQPDAAMISSVTSAAGKVIPELVLLGTVCINFLVGPFLVTPSGRALPGLRHRWGGIAIAAICTALYLWWTGSTEVVTTGPFRVDNIVWYVRGVMLIAALLLVLVNWSQIEDGKAAESHACLLAITAGVNLVALANDLTTLFLALELISIPTYLFLFLPRKDAATQEAGVKYFLLSVFSSAIMLYGFSLIYGMAGTTDLPTIQTALANSNQTPVLAILGMVFVVAGLAFRLTAVPFHFYAPDVFQGSAASGAALLSFVPKLAGFIALIRLLEPVVDAAPGLLLADVMLPMLWWLSVITMFVGNFLGILQNDLRRMLAYSGVAHVGYMLVGLNVGHHTTSVPDGIEALLFYLAVYGLMTIGAFAVLIAAERDNKPLETLDQLAGLHRVRPGLALMLMVFMFSLAGMPPTAGFLAKLNLFFAAWAQGDVSNRWLALFMVINAAMGSWYYLRVVGAMYLREPLDEHHGSHAPAPIIASVACTAMVITLFFVPTWLWTMVQTVRSS
ncbi:proton-translocating NADH-quinone oxidoreductase, chain N [Planctopirus limnophila DSM 3776]|uniref:NADH-quinone oxidoreductase subunit N n=1 Tax=Planctopirus limnophila (strain ATCC 43296 / DSM 3776 / IFAM 1008 / Mu 290) TaxID=521674 RepID=D5SX60_PLAL2|nr:NADH-quinone oxidoreductase subunit N [Planctopirus limnophila]ADG69682.1 proton-translocating NADH-quinone oxidoreductase, chain N [Planctopirus limnophila DSM 3776]